jgi:ubiquitin C-terminal hydrolase
VEFPLRGLDMSQCCSNISAIQGGDSVLYDLYAVSVIHYFELFKNSLFLENQNPFLFFENHMGGIGGGHYTAFGKNPESEIWHEFNDRSVRRIKEDEIVTSAAYVLFYRKRR